MNLETYFPYLLASSAEAFSRKLEEVYGRTYGLSREEWRFLLLLAEAGKLTSLELTKRTTLDKVQVSRAASRLQEKGLISRSVAKTDRRLRLYTCTEEGHGLFAEVFPQVATCSDSIIGKMDPDDLASLTHGLKALGSAIDQYTQEKLDLAS